MNRSPAGGRRRLLAALGLAPLAGWSPGAGAAASNSDPLSRPATPTPRALGAFLVDITTAGPRLVAVGERGTVLLSDDAGKSWRQAPCPVSVTLTAVRFADERRGWAVGHGGVVLATSDGGGRWSVQLDGRRAAALELEAAQAAGDAGRLKAARQLTDDGPDKPLLALHVWPDAQRVLAVGAYGLAFATADGGATWSSAMGRMDNAKGLHLYSIAAGAAGLAIAGEQGLLLRSTDDARSFQKLPSPYQGSWFTAAMTGDAFIVAGLRGNAWRSQDKGASFQACAVPVPVSFTSATPLKDGPLLLVNQAGMVLSSADAGRSFRPLPLPPGPPATALVQAGDGTLVAATVAGPLRLPPLPPVPKAS